MIDVMSRRIVQVVHEGQMNLCVNLSARDIAPHASPGSLSGRARPALDLAPVGAAETPSKHAPHCRLACGNVRVLCRLAEVFL